MEVSLFFQSVLSTVTITIHLVVDSMLDESVDKDLEEISAEDLKELIENVAKITLQTFQVRLEPKCGAFSASVAFSVFKS